MAIDVICPGCHKRFQVSDQYAGQKGPCPGCKTIIEIPKLEDVVVVHERETTASGTPAKLNSIRRQRTTVGKSELLCAFGALVAGLLFTVLARFGLTETHPHPGFLTTVLIGSLLGVSFSLLGNIVLRGQDNGNNYGRTTLLRACLVGVIYTGIWRLLVLISDGLLVEDGIVILPAVIILAIALTVITTFLPMFVFDFEYQQGLVHVAMFISSLAIYSLILGDISLIIK